MYLLLDHVMVMLYYMYAYMYSFIIFENITQQ